jgi:hypothetical protein
MTDRMDDTINSPTNSPLGSATMVIGAIVTRVRAVINALAPDGYEDEWGFHFGSPMFTN